MVAASGDKITVITLGQTISVVGLEAGSWLMDRVLLEGRNLSEKALCIKLK